MQAAKKEHQGDLPKQGLFRSSISAASEKAQRRDQRSMKPEGVDIQVNQQSHDLQQEGSETLEALQAVGRDPAGALEIALEGGKQALANIAKPALHSHTPLFLSSSLSRTCGTRVWLKLENLQPSGSFKIRGIGNICSRAAKESKCTSFVCCSGGNAGLACTFASQQLGIPTLVFLPEVAPVLAGEMLRNEGAEVRVVGQQWDDANKMALEHAAKTPGAFFIPSFDHPYIWEGHSTIVDELRLQLQQTPYGLSGLNGVQEVKPDAIIVAVGGGGLLTGVLMGMKRHGWTDVPVLAVETHGANSFQMSMMRGDGKAVPLEKMSSMATSLMAKTPSQKAVDLAHELLVIPLSVSDEMAGAACCRLAQDHRMLVEMACGAGLSILTYGVIREILPELLSTSNVVCIACGGNLISPDMITQWKTRFRNATITVKSGEEIYMRLPDTPNGATSVNTSNVASRMPQNGAGLAG